MPLRSMWIRHSLGYLIISNYPKEKKRDYLPSTYSFPAFCTAIHTDGTIFLRSADPASYGKRNIALSITACCRVVPYRARCAQKAFMEIVEDNLSFLRFKSKG